MRNQLENRNSQFSFLNALRTETKGKAGTAHSEISERRSFVLCSRIHQVLRVCVRVYVCESEPVCVCVSLCLCACGREAATAAVVPVVPVVAALLHRIVWCS